MISRRGHARRRREAESLRLLEQLSEQRERMLRLDVVADAATDYVNNGTEKYLAILVRAIRELDLFEFPEAE